MYLFAHIWLALLQAFLLGVLASYVMWRLCARPLINARAARLKADFMKNLTALKQQNRQLSQAKAEAERQRDDLKQAVQMDRANIEARGIGVAVAVAGNAGATVASETAASQAGWPQIARGADSKPLGQQKKDARQ